MINGKLFRKVIANSPGGILADSTQGQPPVFISAGLQDNIFPIQQAGNAVRGQCSQSFSSACDPSLRSAFLGVIGISSMSWLTCLAAAGLPQSVLCRMPAT